ncbi:right-handed parallel beta-helix repeat-containing protein [Asanoa siamensis]|uniref:Right handed beta helix region n=1 Tax=Asanoa siamensis TaxID=926357 RepID=A0ABQ4CTF2_9ACTN|nr:right-handed parallel beta-helix repeat-containing protein [Asanoa siamensis]GIF74288.1 hypothetical protein Asi02nite_38060 [Asanoa siamensis]
MRGLALLTAGLLATAGLPVATAAAAAPPATVHVGKWCGPGQDGSESRPYCTIAQAVEVAGPGQTIAVGEGSYAETVVPRSGEPGRPITFTGYQERGARAQVGGTSVPTAFRLSGVHDVVIDGFYLVGSGGAVVVVQDSSDITITDGTLLSAYGGVDIKGDSHRVTISRMALTVGRTAAFAVSGGASDTVLAANSVRLARIANVPAAPAIGIDDAPRTTVVNNTIVTDCLAGVEVTGASAGFALVNSIVRTRNVGVTGPCADPAAARPVTVAGAAAADARVDHNVIDPAHGGPLYSWAGTTYPDPGAFHAATGQGAHDIGVDAKLGQSTRVDGGFGLTADSPAIDSALAGGPAALAVDLRGNAHADKPDTANSGGGYADRGAVELVPTPTISSTIARVPGGGPLDTITTVTRTYPWATDGPIGTFHFSASGQRVAENRTGTARFTFPRADASCMTIEFNVDGFRTYASPVYDAPCVVLGAGYNSLTPQRVLDTRSGAGPVGSNREITISLPAPASSASAVVLNLTATQPVTSGYLKVWPDGELEPNASNLNFAAQQTIANLVTVKPRGGQVRIKNGGRGHTHVLADLVGYYAGTGNGLETGTPTRVLDTRAAIGVPGTAPVTATGNVTVDLSVRVPAGTTAAVLNLTATEATTTGLFTAFPPGSSVPTASNLNFVAGQTVNNMVIAPVVDGKVAFAYSGKGSAHLLADLAGWFAPGTHDTYLPTWQSRLVDTRTTGASVAPGQTLRVVVNASACGSVNCDPRAVVANLTVTKPQKSGYLSVYPYGQARPTQSVLNFTAGQTVASLVTVGLGEESFLVYNGGKGTVDVIVDQAGFYLAQVE